MLENPRPFVLLSVRALAGRLGTDPATTVRIVQGLGFETYKDFQRHLHDLSVAYATSLDTMKAAEREGTGPASLVRAALQRDMQNLQALSNSLDANKICALGQDDCTMRRKYSCWVETLRRPWYTIWNITSR